MLNTTTSKTIEVKKEFEEEDLFHVHLYRLDDENSYFSHYIFGSDRSDIFSKLEKDFNLIPNTYDVINIKQIFEFENHLTKNQHLFHAHFSNSKGKGFDIHKHFFAFSFEDASDYLTQNESILINSYNNFSIEKVELK